MIKLAIHSAPRSGSSWLGEIINSAESVNYSYQPLFSYEFKSYLNESSSERNVNMFFDSISCTEDSFIRQKEERKKGIKPDFNKLECKCVAYKEVRYHNILANLLKVDKDVKVIALVRNPLAVISSWYSAPREFRKDLGWDLNNELLYANKKNEDRKEEYFGLLKWVESAKEFEKLQLLYKNRFYLIKYDSLLQDTENEVEKLFDFIGLSSSNQTFEFINENKNNVDSYSVFKNKKHDNNWKTVLSIDIQNKIIDVVNDAGLEKYL